MSAGSIVFADNMDEVVLRTIESSFNKICAKIKGRDKSPLEPYI